MGLRNQRARKSTKGRPGPKLVPGVGKAVKSRKTVQEGQTKESIAAEVKRLIATEKISERKAIAHVTDLPYSTVKAWLCVVPNKNIGAQPYLGAAFEERLVQLILEASDMGFPIDVPVLKVWVCALCDF